MPDAELFDWIAGRAAPPPEYDNEVTRLLLAFRYTPRATSRRRLQLSTSASLAHRRARAPCAVCSARPRGMTPRRSARCSPRPAAPTWLHVCRDDGRMARFAAALAFFHPELNVLSFPAWDCLPYDRVSPNAEIVSRRIDMLTRLARRHTSSSRFVAADDGQRGGAARAAAPTVRRPRADAGPGGRIPLDRLQSFFRNNGYIRTDTVREPGEYAVRGGIVDLWPSGAATADPARFLRRHARKPARLRPADAALDRTARRFRAAPGQRSLARRRRDPAFPLALPRGVRRGRHRRPALRIGQRRAAAGRHGALAAVLLRDARNAVRLPARRRRSRSTTRPRRRARHRLDSIADFYAARETIGAKPRSTAPLYRPVKPDRMFLGEADWKEGARRAAPSVQLSPFAAAARRAGPTTLVGSPARARAGEKFRRRARRTRTSTCSTRCATISPPSRKPAAAPRSPPIAKARPTGSPPSCASTASPNCAASPTPPRSRNCRQRAVGLALLPLEQGFATDDLLLLGEQDILGDRLARTPRRRRNVDEFITEAASLSPGDLVVHAEHGIGRYEGLETIDVAGAPHDCLKVLYAGDDRLFVPVENIEVLSRYGSEDTPATARPARRGRLAGAQGPGQAAHPRDRRRTDPHRRRAPAAPRRDDGPARGALRGIRRPLPVSRDRRPAARDRGHAVRHGRRASRWTG